MKKRGMLLLVLLLVPLVSAQDFIKSGEIPKDMPSTEVVATLAKPAVIQVKTFVRISGMLPTIEVSEGRVIETGPENLNIVTKEYVGSGFMVTSDGYAVTNAHVIQVNPEEVIVPFIQEVLNRQGIPFEMHSMAGPYLEDRVKDLEVVTDNVFVLLPVYGLSGLTQLQIPADVKKVGMSYPGKDVAILKLPKRIYPTVSLGSSEDLSVGANIMAIGYPVAAVIGHEPNEATVTAGIVSAHKFAEGGWKLIQIDATISHGNSGGPVLDKDGKVVGIATIGSREVEGFNWIVPTEIVEEFLTELNVQNQRSVLDQTYEHAIALYWNNHYEQSLIELHHVRELMPSHPLAPEFIYRSRLALEERHMNAFSWQVVVFIFGFVSIAVAIFLFFFVVKEKKEITKLKRRLRRR